METERVVEQEKVEVVEEKLSDKIEHTIKEVEEKNNSKLVYKGFISHKNFKPSEVKFNPVRIESAKEWLDAKELKKSKYLNSKITSKSLASMVTKETGKKITNGEMIIALAMSGYKVKPIKVNAKVNVGFVANKDKF